MTGWRLVTPRGASGAIAIIQIEGEGVDGALSRLGIGEVGVGAVALRDILGVDRGVVMRPCVACVQLMPHGGRAVVEVIGRKLTEAGLEPSRGGDPRLVYPEASSLLEARMLEALARAASPRAVDLLMEQPRLWAEAGAASDPELDRVRRRLIEPALVVAMGPANIGKSTLLNALAGRAVAVVSEEPGTTRDHVGVLLDVDGVTIRYVDTPGVREGGPAVEREARELAGRVVSEADLVLRCGDAGAGPVEAGSLETGLGEFGGESVVVALRRDLGEAGFEADARVSAVTGEGLRELARLIRERLVPDRALGGSCWRFWEG